MIETITADRFAEILPVFRQVQQLHADLRPEGFRSDWDTDEVARFFADRLEGGATCLVHRIDGTVTGYLVYRVIETPQSPLKRPERFAMLEEIAVDSVHRRTGIARALIADMRRRLAEDAVTRWRATYHEFNAASAALMAEVGAHPIVHVAEGEV